MPPRAETRHLKAVSLRQTLPHYPRWTYEAASLTGLSRDLLYDQMRCGNLDYIKIGRRRLITRQHLEQFLQIAPKPQPPPAA